MQILYGIALLVVIVLCAALFLTTRRILRSTPLSSGQIDFASAQPILSIEDRLEAAVFSAKNEEIKPPRIEESIPAAEPDADIEWNPSTMDSESTSDVELSAVTDLALESAPPYSASISASESVPEKMVAGQPIPTPDIDSIYAAEENTAAMEIDAREQRQRVLKSSRRTYRRALEYLLVGVSAFVLIQTQRNMRFRVAHPAGSRVA